jgi:S1-C subfamily serine protease
MKKLLYTFAGVFLFTIAFAFTDTVPNAWYMPALQWAANHNIISGYPDGSFHPDAPITRAELAQMLYNYDRQRSTDEARTIAAITKAYPSVVIVHSGGDAGAGVIVDSTHIVTAYHVIDSGTSTVILSDGRQYQATYVKAYDVDLALLEFHPDKPVTPIALGEMPQIGQTAIAVGNPYDIGQSVSKGIVSATDRVIPVLGNPVHEIQVDTPINPGNSGGALINEDGELIGIIDAKEDGSDGVGFAIPVDAVKQLTH